MGRRFCSLLSMVRLRVGKPLWRVRLYDVGMGLLITINV